MNSIDLLRGLSDIDDKYIEEAAPDPAFYGSEFPVAEGTSAEYEATQDNVITPEFKKPVVRNFRKYYIFAGIAAAAVIVFISLKVFDLRGPISKSATAPASDVAMDNAEMAPAADEAAMEAESESAKSEESADESYAEAVPADDNKAEEEAAQGVAEIQDNAQAPVEAAAEASEAAEEAAPATESEETLDREEHGKKSFGIDQSEIAGSAKISDSVRSTKDSTMRPAKPDEIKKIMGHEFVIPEGASIVTYRVSDSMMAESTFDLGDTQCRLTMKRTDRFEDISGLYYNWDEESEIKINGKDAILYKYGKVSCCMWYDDTDGTMYCVSVIGDGSSSVNVEELSAEAFD